MPNPAPAYSFGGLTRPPLNFDSEGRVILDPAAAAFAAAYGTKALYAGLPADTPFPPVMPTLSAPVDVNAGATTVLENAATNSTVGLTALTTNTGGPPVTYSLTDNAGGRFKIDANTGVVTVANGALLDYETSPGHAYTVVVQASDGILTTSQAFSIGVGNVNEAPAGTNATVTTGEDTSRVFTAADFGLTDPSDSSAPNALAAVRIVTLPAAGTLLNNGVAVSAGDFISAAAIASGQLVFVPAAEASGAAYASFTFQVRDNGGTANGGVDLDPTPNTITINVTTLNDAPTATGLTQSLVVTEDAAATPLFTVPPTIADVDNTGVTIFLRLDAAAGVLIGAGAGSLAGGIRTYGFSGQIAAVTALLAGVSFEPAANFSGSTSVAVSVNDGTNGPQGTNPTGTISITVNPVDDAPTASNLTQILTFDEDAPAATLFAVAPVVTDVDSIVTATLTLADATAGVLIGAGTGVPLLGALVYTISGTPADVSAALAAVQFDSAPDFNGATSVATSIDDGVNAAVSGNVSIVVNAINDAPAATNLTQSVTINEDAAAVPLFTQAPVISDADSGTVTATLTLDAAAGVLTGAGAGVLAAGVLTYTITDTPSAVTAALAAVAYDSAPNFFGTANVGVAVSDGVINGPQGANPAGSIAITVNSVNDAPTVTATSNNPIYAPGVDLFSAVSASSVESGQVINQIVLSVSNVSDTDESLVIDGDTVALVDGTVSGAPTATLGVSYTVAMSGTTAVITITSPGLTGAQTATLIDALSYTNTTAALGEPSRVVTIVSLTDDGGTALGGVATGTPGIASSVNYVVAPTISVDGVVNYVENDAAALVDSTVTISDPDDTHMESATIAITTGYAAGEDVLTFTNTANITGSLVGNTLTATGHATMAEYETFLESIRYQNTSEAPSTAQRIVTYTVNDGTANSAAATATINVAAVNDVPVIDLDSATGGTQSTATTATFSEGAGPPSTAVFVVPNLDLDDVDNANLTGAVVRITDYVAGQDVLTVAGNASGTIGGISYLSSGGIINFSGAGSVADYQAAIQAVQYNNSSENPGPNARHVEIVVTDGTGFSTAATATVNVAGQNDAPVNTVPADSAVPTAFSNTDTAISGISIADVDVGSGIVTTQLSVTNGTVAVTLSGGATISAGVNGSPTLTLSGTVADINATLGNNVTFHSTDGFTGQANLTVLTNDAGNSGSGGALVDTDVVHIGVVPQVWFIDNTNLGANGPGGTGTAADPFRSIADFNGATGTGANDYIVIRTGTGTYTGEGLNLQDGQQVWGAGETLSFTNPVNGNQVNIANAGARPTINVTVASDQGVDLAANNVIRNVNISTASGTSGLDDGNNSVGNLVVRNVDISGAGQAVDIDQGGNLDVQLGTVSSSGGTHGIQLAGTAGAGSGLLSGSFSANSGAISGSGNAGFLVGDGAGGTSTGGTAAISYGGSVTASNGAAVVSIQDHATGAVTLSGNLTHNGSSGAGIVLDDNSSNFTFSGASANLNTGSSTAINITDQSGGTVTFTGAVNIDTTSGVGVNFGGVSAGNVNFNGGNLTIDTTGGQGFVATATANSTVSVTGSGNHINSGSGVALNITNTTIGASNVTFQDISANGAGKGIVLNTTGTSGHLSVTGVGSTDGSGGTIQNIGARGIELINTQQVSINNVNLTNANTTDGAVPADLDITGSNAAIYMSNVNGAGFNNVNINGTVDNGITGINVANFTLANSTITQAGNAANESGIEFSNLSGVSSITNSDISFSETNSVDIVNTGVNLTLTVTGSTFRDTQTVSSGGATSSLGEGGIQFRSFSSGAAPTTNLIIDDNDFLNLRTQAIQVIGEDNSIVNVNVIDNTIDALADVAGTPNPADATHIGAGIDINSNDTSDVNFNVYRNTIDSRGGAAVNITSFATSNIEGRIYNNLITAEAGVGAALPNGNAGGSGIRLLSQEGSDGVFDVRNNNITMGSLNNSSAIDVQARIGDSRLDLTLDNNSINSETSALADINITSGSSAAGETTQVFANIINNDIAAGGPTNVLRLRVSDLDGTSDPRIFLTGFVEGGAGIEDDAVATWNANGNTPGITAATVAVSLTGTAVGPSAGNAQLPGNPTPTTLTAAAGGVQALAPTPGETNLTQAQLDSIVSAAIAQWAHAGASQAQLAALASLAFAVTDLGGNNIGLHIGSQILIDRDAAGHGWFVDSTPWDNFEFAQTAGSALIAAPSSAAAGHLDLLTAVAHEMGHELGMPDLTLAGDSHDLMFGSLVDGERRLPDAGDLQPAQHAQAQMQGQAPLLPVIRGTAGNDIIDAGHGGKILVGEAGADKFVFSSVDAHGPTPPPLTHVADYRFIEGDVFDFSALTAAVHGSGISDAYLVRAVEGPGGAFATLQVNTADFSLGSKVGPNWTDVAQIDGARAGDDVNVLVGSQGAVHLAHLQVGLLV